MALSAAAAARDGSGDKGAPSASPSKPDPPAPLPQNSDGKDGNYTSRDILATIDSFKKQVVSDRDLYIKKKMEENKKKLNEMTEYMYSLSKTRRSISGKNTDINDDFLMRRQEDALCTVNSLEPPCGDKDNSNFQEESPYTSSNVLMGNHFGGKNGIRPIKLPEVPKLSPYTTWIFLDRNQRMTEDQSVVGRRRIYYDQACGEALICSDSDDDIIDDEEEKKEFGNAEDYIIWMTIKQVGLYDTVLDSLSHCLGKDSGDIRARYETLLQRDRNQESVENVEVKVDDKVAESFLEKDLNAALDSFDNLFCRRCLVFDCRLHGCSQDLVFPAEKQLPWSSPEDEAPCGIHCYKLACKPDSVLKESLEESGGFDTPTHSYGVPGRQLQTRKKLHGPPGRKIRSNDGQSASDAKVDSDSAESDPGTWQDIMPNKLSLSPSKLKLGGKLGVRKKNNKRVAERVLMCIRKKQKKIEQSGSGSMFEGCPSPHETKLRSNTSHSNKNGFSPSRDKVVKSPAMRKIRNKGLLEQQTKSTSIETRTNGSHINIDPLTENDEILMKQEFLDENRRNIENTDSKKWKTIEHGLFVKGLEIFGMNSCLIARNLLSGFKTCMEVYDYMNKIQNNMLGKTADGAFELVNGHNLIDFNVNLGNKLRTRSRFMRRRGRVRRLKYTWKSAGYHSIRKRISERKDQPCRQYNPCGCQSACGKQCPCLLNGTCCEKYCGCPKICKNRFRGCHCAKSQCRSRQCPCFAAGRECDPDVCRNCWVGCGDGTLGGPNQIGDNYECRNMKLLLKQQQRVLLGRSDVSGWGAFLKNSVGKHEYLGEYTGELISHREADKRGKIYDRVNSSFLFNLNDQFVLDAYRKGDKLKFANHSPNPNCYAKVIMVAGDHRVGIFAKERISAGEEIFYDYRYELDSAPAWARKPEALGSKKDEFLPSTGRAKKLA